MLRAPCCVKGIYVMHLREYLSANHGPGAIERIESGVASESAMLLRSPFAHEWYPLIRVVPLELAILEAYYGGDPSECARLGRFDIDVSLSTVYRFLLRLLNQETLILKAGRIWSNFYDAGRLIPEKTGERSGNIRVVDFNPIHLAHCHEIRGAVIGALELCGTKDPKVDHTRCVLEGAPECRFEITW